MTFSYLPACQGFCVSHVCPDAQETHRTSGALTVLPDTGHQGSALRLPTAQRFANVQTTTNQDQTTTTRAPTRTCTMWRDTLANDSSQPNPQHSANTHGPLTHTCPRTHLHDVGVRHACHQLITAAPIAQR